VAHVGVQVAQLKDGKSVEGGGQGRACNGVAPNADVLRVSAPSPVKSRSLEQERQDGVEGVPVLGVEKVDALPEYARFMIALDAQPLARMETAQPLLQQPYGLL
jgi:hypothetical protein